MKKLNLNNLYESPYPPTDTKILWVEISLKIIPMLIALCYMINTALAYVDIDIPVLSNLAGMSLFTWIFVYLASIVFKFCSYHRMFLYYILITDTLNIIDYYVGIPMSDFSLMMLYNVIMCLTLFIVLYLYVKSHKRTTSKDGR